MAVFKRRTRMVSFRLSESEYEELRNLCVAHGARSLSDFARFVVCRVVGAKTGTPLDTLEELNREVKRLAELIERTSLRVE